MKKPWRGAAYWLVPHGLLSLLSYRTQDHLPRGDISHHGIVPLSHQSFINQDNTPRDLPAAPSETLIFAELTKS